MRRAESRTVIRVATTVALLLAASGCAGVSPSATSEARATATSQTSGQATPPAMSVAPPPDVVAFSLVGHHAFGEIADLYFCCYIDVGPDGHLFVPEGGRSEIWVLDATSTVVRRWGEQGSGPGQFGFLRSPQFPESAIGGIAVLPDGSSYVAEAGNKRVQYFNASGESVLTWGSHGTGDGQFLDPIAVAVAPGGEVFVVDDERDDIQVFTPEGDYLRTIGRPGHGPGEIADPGAIRIRSDGTLVLADFGGDRIHAWDLEGNYLWSLGSHGDDPGQFFQPQDVAFGADSSVIVVDDNRVQVFDRQRRLIGMWPDQPSPDHLASIAVSGDTLWVVAPYVDTLIELRVLPTP